MKEFEKLLFEDTKRKENEKAMTEIKLGLFEQKQKSEFDFSNYTLMTYHKKYKGLYDLYQNNDTMELVYVCPLIENNKGAEDERKDMTPYGYDVLYLEYLDGESYEVVKKAHVHEKSRFIDTLVYTAIGLYFTLVLVTICTIAYLIIEKVDFTSFLLLTGSLITGVVVSTALLPVLLIKHRQFKAE